MRDTQGPSAAPKYDINQEREFYKYFQPLELGLSRLFKHNGTNGRPHSSPRASPDRALTAFAQLAALRLNCRRAFISFFDRENQYIVAEATRSLSLETHCASQPGDELTFGLSINPRRNSLCEHTVSVPLHLDQHGKDDSSFVICDCSKDPRFNSAKFTTEYGFRFYAGVPIVSPEGYRIGSYCVIDDSPRDRLEDDQLAFMKDMATTVMVHMDMLRAKTETIKCERMVRGLGSFIEGKTSVDDWWMGSDDHRTPTAEAEGSPSDHTPQWASKQYSMHHDNPSSQTKGPDNKEPAKTKSSVFNYEKAAPDQGSEDADLKPIEHSPKAKETEKQDTLSVEVKAAFGRASRIMREALGVDGVCCFDAKAGNTFGGLIDQQQNERSKRRKISHDYDSSESPSDIEHPQQDGKQDQDKPCEVLGFSTTEYSSINGDQSEKVTDGMTESLLRSLLRRFCHGEIINFDESGNSPNEKNAPSNAPADWPAPRPDRKKYQKLRPGEAAYLRKIFPGVRSMAIVPLWDSKQQFFSGCVAWTRSAYRVLTPHPELSYLAAFGDSIMSEVSRVDTKIQDQAKSSFISSISHELRSPLHGILGSIECLQDSELDPFQENLTHTVNTCAKTLLDCVDHLLDYAGINNFTRKGTSKQEPGKKNAALDVDVDLSVVTEEVLETVFAGYDFMKVTSDVQHDGGGPVTSSATSFAQRAQQLRRKSSVPGLNKKKAVSVVVDISKAEQSHWIFRTQAGAWRRILMNLFGNSLKYTEQGFVHVKLHAKPLPQEGKIAKSTVILTVSDSGKGIGKEYLDKSLFVPFAQEDSLQPGTGLGLAITSSIIRSMGGTIEVKSEKGHGTEFRVTLEMVHAPYSQDSLEQSIISSAARQTKGLKIGFVGFDADSFKERPESEDRSPDNARHHFMSSFHRLCQNWFGMDMKIMNGLDQSDADIFLTTEEGLSQIEDALDKKEEKQSDKDAQIAVKATPLLVLCHSASVANGMLHAENVNETADIIEYISQPCGPRKLAKSMVLCLDRLEALKNGKKRDQVVSKVHDNKNSSLHEQDERALSNGVSKLSVRKLEKMSDSKADDERRQADTMDTSEDMAPAKASPPPGGKSKKPKARSRNTAPASSGSNKGPPKQESPKVVRNVLLADDNKINLQLLVTYIQKTGHNFTTAGNGLIALETYKEQCSLAYPELGNESSAAKKDKDQRASPFDYILMDVTMPVMDGLEATRQIRQYERANNIKPTTVVALTGLASADAQQEAYTSGVNTFITKPVKLKDLGNLLNREDGQEEAQK